MKHIDRKINPPTTSGTMGEAWRIDLEAVQKATGKTADQDACVSAWIVYAPFASTTIAYYAVLTVHLRDSVTLGPATITREGSTHEILVYALNPEAEPCLTDPMRTALKPTRYAGQWNASEGHTGLPDESIDSYARTTTGEAIDKIIAGELSPEVDRETLQPWVDIFGDANLWEHHRE